jgi:hypothetical protein
MAAAASGTIPATLPGRDLHGQQPWASSTSASVAPPAGCTSWHQSFAKRAGMAGLPHLAPASTAAVLSACDQGLQEPCIPWRQRHRIQRCRLTWCCASTSSPPWQPVVSKVISVGCACDCRSWRAGRSMRTLRRQCRRPASAAKPPLQVRESRRSAGCACVSCYGSSSMCQSSSDVALPSVCSRGGGLSIARLASTAATRQPELSWPCVTGFACHSVSSTAPGAVDLGGVALPNEHLACQPGCIHAISRQAPAMWWPTLQAWPTGQRPLLRRGRSSRRGGQGGRRRSRAYARPRPAASSAQQLP